MTFDIEKMKLAVAGGLSPVCASCQHYWRARSEKLPEPQCLSAGSCGSPIAGLTFPFYDGPMKGALDRWCFMCGSPASLQLVVEGLFDRPIGICGEDILRARDLDPIKLSLVQETTSRRRIFVKSPSGSLIPLETFGVIPRFKSTLLETMHEVDQLLAAGKKL